MLEAVILGGALVLFLGVGYVRFRRCPHCHALWALEPDESGDTFRNLGYRCNKCFQPADKEIDDSWTC